MVEPLKIKAGGRGQLFQRVQPQRAFEAVTAQLEAAILGGAYADGERLPAERVLQQAFAVSRNTLRESLRVLEQKGLVEIRKGQRGGVFVKAVNAEPMAEQLRIFLRSRGVSLTELSEFRQDLEGLLARRAARRCKGRARKLLEALLARAAALAIEGPRRWEEFMAADRDIHLALAQLAGNPLHRFFLETVHQNVHQGHIRAFLPRSPEVIRTTLAELEALVDAVIRGDGERAEKLAREHVARATRIMQRAAARRPQEKPT